MQNAKKTNNSQICLSVIKKPIVVFFKLLQQIDYIKAKELQL